MTADINERLRQLPSVDIEIALRVIRACKPLGVETVAAYSEADAESPHLDAADVKVCIGPPKSADSYLNMEAIIQAAEQAGCCAIHPGYGFLAENAKFASECKSHSIEFIGPPPNAIEAMGSKIESKKMMKDAGVPVIPGVEEGIRDPERAKH